MRKETVEIDNRYGEQYAGKYIFQEIAWAKRSRIIQKHTKYNKMTGNVLSNKRAIVVIGDEADVLAFVSGGVGQPQFPGYTSYLILV